jgi:hypothetical protein
VFLTILRFARMRRSVAQFNGSEASNRTPSLADFITVGLGFRYTPLLKVGQFYAGMIGNKKVAASHVGELTSDIGDAKRRPELRPICAPLVGMPELESLGDIKWLCDYLHRERELLIRA